MLIGDFKLARRVGVSVRGGLFLCGPVICTSTHLSPTRSRNYMDELFASAFAALSTEKFSVSSSSHKFKSKHNYELLVDDFLYSQPWGETSVPSYKSDFYE